MGARLAILAILLELMPMLATQNRRGFPLSATWSTILSLDLSTESVNKHASTPPFSIVLRRETIELAESRLDSSKRVSCSFSARVEVDLGDGQTPRIVP